MADLPEFDLRFELTESEFCKAHRGHLQRSLFSIKNIVLLTTALAIGAIQAQMFGGADWALKIFGLLWILVLAFMGWAYVFLPGRLFRGSPRHSGPQRIRTEADGLTLEQGDRRHFMPWSEISRVGEADGAVLVSPRHGVPILVPERAFASPEDRSRFLRLVYTEKG